MSEEEFINSWKILFILLACGGAIYITYKIIKVIWELVKLFFQFLRKYGLIGLCWLTFGIVVTIIVVMWLWEPVILPVLKFIGHIVLGILGFCVFCMLAPLFKDDYRRHDWPYY